MFFHFCSHNCNSHCFSLINSTAHINMIIIFLHFIFHFAYCLERKFYLLLYSLLFVGGLNPVKSLCDAKYPTCMCVKGLGRSLSTYIFFLFHILLIPFINFYRIFYYFVFIKKIVYYVGIFL